MDGAEHEYSWRKGLNTIFENWFSYFSIKTCVVGTQKNRLNETVLLSTQNTCLNWCVRKWFQFYVKHFGYLDIYRPVYYYVFWVFSMLVCLKIDFMDCYCKTTHRTKSRFFNNFLPTRIFFCLRELTSSLIHDCINYHEQTSRSFMLREQVSANQPHNC